MAADPGTSRARGAADWVAPAKQDVIVSSNTYAWEQKFQWTGLCIKPNPELTGAAWHTCLVMGAVVGGTRMEPVSISYAEISSIWRQCRVDNHDAFGAEVKKVLLRIGAPREMEYLSLNVEGAETLIRQHFPLDEHSSSRS
jgi:hypothetical protein